MKALTVWQPWAWAIIHAGKDVENRTWQTSHRGLLFIHAGKQEADPRDVAVIERWAGPLPEELVYGAIIGHVQLVDVVERHASLWAQRNRWHWVLSNPRPLSRPIPCRGAPGLWVPDVRIVWAPDVRIVNPVNPVRAGASALSSDRPL